MRDSLSAQESTRYARHLTLDEIGEVGQLRLRGSSALVVGAGGLGSPCLLYLAAAGVGRIGLIDFDTVDLSNLQRQVLFDSQQIGRPKTAAAAERLSALNPEIRIEPHQGRLGPDNALALIASYDVIIDGSDRFSTRYLVSDACEIVGRPLVHAAIQRFEGQLSVFHHAGGPGLRDLFPEPPPPEQAPRCAEVGVLGVLPGILGTLQASETLKLLLGIGEPLSGRLLLFDALSARFRTLKVHRDPRRPPVRDLIAHAPPPWTVLDPEQVRDRLLAGWRPTVLDVRSAEEASIDQLEGTTLRREPGDLDARDLPEGDVLIYCASGVRSANAARRLVQRGEPATRIFEVRGGLSAWRRS